MAGIFGIISEISVEPVVLFYSATIMLSSSLSTELLSNKACDPTNAKKTSSECDYGFAKEHVMASINAWKPLVLPVVPIVVAMIAGTWSDRRGRRRKPLIMWPIAGQILADVMSLYCAFNWSVSAQVTAAVQTVAIACTGTNYMFFGGINSFVGDTTSEKCRTIKYAMVNASEFGGILLGLVVFGKLSNINFVLAYVVTVGFGLITFASLALVKDNAPHGKNDTAVTAAKPLSFCQDVQHTVNPINVFRSCYHLLTKRRDHNKSNILWLAVFICAPLTSVLKEGETIVLQIFLTYRWSEVNFRIFTIYVMLFMSFGTLFVLYFLSYRLRIDDAIIGTIATVFALLSSIVFIVAYQSWHLYLALPFDVFFGAANTLTSSIASKCVKVDELGAMNSVKLLMEELITSIFIPLYSFVFNLTLESMPNAFFFISIMLISPQIVVFLFIYYMKRKSISSKC